jgi:hypothetical protein
VKILSILGGKMRLSPLLFVVIILIAFSISPPIVSGEDGRNLFLIGLMALSPLIIIKYRKFYGSDIWLLLFLLSIVLIPIIANPGSMRWSTVLYSIMFGVTFLAYKRLLYRNNFTLKNYQELLKYLIYAYFIVLLIQQFCVLTGLPIFNVAPYYTPMQPWKLNSLAVEPSHSARIVALLMYCYITSQEFIKGREYSLHLDIKQDMRVWLAFLWTMITMSSGTAFLFLFIVLLKFLKFRNLISLFVILGMIVTVVNIMDIGDFERTVKVFLATLTLDPDKIMHTDHSASIRIVPMIALTKAIDLTTFNGWFGYGIDYTSYYLSGKIPGVSESFTGGGLISFLIEYGFISFVLFSIFSLSTTIKKDDYLSLVFWFMLIFATGINSQITWLAIILLFTNKFFVKKIVTRRL